jgi:hypothetical protein
MKDPHASVRLKADRINHFLESSQRCSLIAIAMPTSLVTSNVAAPAMSPNTHFAVQSATVDTSTFLFSKCHRDHILEGSTLFAFQLASS